MRTRPVAATGRLQRIMDKLQARARQLNTEGFSTGDVSALEKRFKLLWSSKSQDDDAATSLGEVTLWRHQRSRALHKQIQTFDNHVFLASLIVITPTQAASKVMRDVLTHLRKMKDYELYRFTLKKEDHDILESMATKDGFSDNFLYREMMGAICPTSSTQASNEPATRQPTQIQFSFSQVPLDRLSLLSQLIVPGSESSIAYAQERLEGLQKTKCVHIFKRPEGQDGSIITGGSAFLHSVRASLGMAEDW